MSVPLKQQFHKAIFSHIMDHKLCLMPFLCVLQFSAIVAYPQGLFYSQPNGLSFTNLANMAIISGTAMCVPCCDMELCSECHYHPYFSDEEAMVGKVEFCYLLGHIALGKTRIRSQLPAQTRKRRAERKHGKGAAWL